MLEVGMKAPRFTLPDKNGKLVSAFGSNYVALDMYVYADGECLYIADSSTV